MKRNSDINKEIKSNGFQDQSPGTPRLPGAYPVNSAAHCPGKRIANPASAPDAFRVVIEHQFARRLTLWFSTGHLMSGCHVPCGWLSQQLQWGHEQRRQQRLRLVWFIQQYDERVLLGKKGYLWAVISFKLAFFVLVGYISPVIRENYG